MPRGTPRPAAPGPRRSMRPRRDSRATTRCSPRRRARRRGGGTSTTSPTPAGTRSPTSTAPRRTTTRRTTGRRPPPGTPRPAWSPRSSTACGRAACTGSPRPGTCNVVSPTFWGKYRLTTIATDGLAGTTLEPSDSWTLARERMKQVTSETGGVTTVTYDNAPSSFTSGNFPAEDADGTVCYPDYWTPPGGSSPVEDWFSKYV